MPPTPLRPNPTPELSYSDWKRTALHNSSVNYKTELCPYRDENDEEKCRYAEEFKNISCAEQGTHCCFAHNKKQLRRKPTDTGSSFTNDGGEFDLLAWPLRPNNSDQLGSKDFKSLRKRYAHQKRYKSLLCPFRNSHAELKCPFASEFASSIEPKRGIHCCFAHSNHQLRQYDAPDGFQNSHGVFDLSVYLHNLHITQGR